MYLYSCDAFRDIMMCLVHVYHSDILMSAKVYNDRILNTDVTNALGFTNICLSMPKPLFYEYFL